MQSHWLFAKTKYQLVKKVFELEGRLSSRSKKRRHFYLAVYVQERNNKKKNNGRKCKISGGSVLPLDTLILPKQISVL